MKRSTQHAIRAMFAVWAGLLLAGYVSQAVGQVVTVTPRKGDDFRAVYGARLIVLKNPSAE